LEAYKQYISVQGDGKGGGARRGHSGEEQESENDSGHPSFGKESVLLLHLTSAAADLGLTLPDFCHLLLYTHRGQKNHETSMANS